MECGKEASVEWIKNNARYEDIVKILEYNDGIYSPEVAKKIGNFLEEDDEDEDDDF